MFLDRIQRNTQTYVNLFSQVVDENMPQATVNFKDEDLSSFDVLMEQRKYNVNEVNKQKIAQGINLP